MWRNAKATCATADGEKKPIHLLHDTGLALGEGDVTTRLVLDELDFNFPSLATRLVFIVIIVLHLLVGASALDATTRISTCVAIASDLIVVAGRRVLVVLGDLGGHDVWERGRKRYCVVTLTLWVRKGWGSAGRRSRGAGDLGG